MKPFGGEEVLTNYPAADTISSTECDLYPSSMLSAPVANKLSRLGVTHR